MTKLALIFVVAASINVFGQEAEETLQKVLRINLISPGIEIESPISKESTIAVNAGIGVSTSYPNLSVIPNSGLHYFIAPFVDVSYKKFYDIEAWPAKGKSISGNSGVYWGIRLLTNLNELQSVNVNRYYNVDCAVGPRWGIQRSMGNFHILVDGGPVFYFDGKGNNGFFPMAIQLNLGYNVKKW